MRIETTPSVVLHAFGATDIGQRKNNEDAFLVDEAEGLFIVADGIGGHARGEVASWFTSENLLRIVSFVRAGSGTETLEPLPEDAASFSYDELLTYAVWSINRQIFEKNERAAAEIHDALKPEDEAIVEQLRQRRRMGTTLVSLLVRGDRAWVTHIGDSRVYRLSGGNVSCLTRDHSWVEEQVQAGLLSPDEAKTHRKRNVITRSVGGKGQVKADIDMLTLAPPERFLLCSDGLSNVVNVEEIATLATVADVRDGCEQLVNLARDSGGRDNITAVLVDVRPQRQPEDGDRSPSLSREDTDL